MIDAIEAERLMDLLLNVSGKIQHRKVQSYRVIFTEAEEEAIAFAANVVLTWLSGHSVE